MKIYPWAILCEKNKNKKNSHKSNIIQSFVKYKEQAINLKLNICNIGGSDQCENGLKRETYLLQSVTFKQGHS